VYLSLVICSFVMCRDVKIYRLISKNSIEEAILRCAEKKLKLEMDVTGSGQKGRTWCFVGLAVQFSVSTLHNFASNTGFDCWYIKVTMKIQNGSFVTDASVCISSAADIVFNLILVARV